MESMRTKAASSSAWWNRNTCCLPRLCFVAGKQTDNLTFLQKGTYVSNYKSKVQCHWHELCFVQRSCGKSCQECHRRHRCCRESSDKFNESQLGHPGDSRAYMRSCKQSRVRYRFRQFGCWLIIFRYNRYRFRQFDCWLIIFRLNERRPRSA